MLKHRLYITYLIFESVDIAHAVSDTKHVPDPAQARSGGRKLDNILALSITCAFKRQSAWISLISRPVRLLELYGNDSDL